MLRTRSEMSFAVAKYFRVSPRFVRGYYPVGNEEEAGGEPDSRLLVPSPVAQCSDRQLTTIVVPLRRTRASPTCKVHS